MDPAFNPIATAATRRSKYVDFDITAVQVLGEIAQEHGGGVSDRAWIT
jgi:hypothetical protein